MKSCHFYQNGSLVFVAKGHSFANGELQFIWQEVPGVSNYGACRYMDINRGMYISIVSLILSLLLFLLRIVNQGMVGGFGKRERESD